MGVEISDNLVVPAPPEVSVLVVGYKSLCYIERCLRGAITSAQGHHFEFLFIDCSDDGSETLVRKQFPQVRVLPYQGNLGFGRGNNVLAAVAYGKRMLLLNPDAFARRDELSMTRASNPWDDAAMESFFSTLQFELLSRNRFEKFEDVRAAIIEWIDDFYNSQRRHTTIGGTSPIKYELSWQMRRSRT